MFCSLVVMLLVSLCALFPSGVNAQCSPGSSTVCIDVISEAYGTENLVIGFTTSTGIVCSISGTVTDAVLNRTSTITSLYTGLVSTALPSPAVPSFTLQANGGVQVLNFAFTDGTFLYQLYGGSVTSNPGIIFFATSALGNSSQQPLTKFTVGCSVLGDPQFLGLRGQSYQVHGIDGAVYNLVTSSSTQVNSRFVFLSKGQCPIVEGVESTNCWSHAGSYLGSIGVQQLTPDGLQQLAIFAGPAQKGFEQVLFNNYSLAVGASWQSPPFAFNWLSSHRIRVNTADFTFILDNSDRFINHAAVPRVPLSRISAHGLFGQTHNRQTYPSVLKYIAGSVDDYLVEEDDLFGRGFVYNQFGLTSQVSGS